MRKLCIYHGNCADGFGAAWAVREALGDDVEFHAGVYQDPPPDVTDRDVILVDFSYKYDVLVEMSWKAKSILVLDHHKSAAEDLGRLPWAGKTPDDFRVECAAYCQSCNMPHIGAIFDMERSGAGLAWDFFHPGKPRPRLIDYIEDRDLWRFNLTASREINAALFSYPYDFNIWSPLMKQDLVVLHTEGVGIERKHHKDVAELVAVTRREMVIGGFRVPAASLPYTYTSDAGALMCQPFDDGSGVSWVPPFAACYWDTPDGRVFSLRSLPNGSDVSEIAKQYGGGGHRNAAGFRVPLDQIAKFEIG